MKEHDIQNLIREELSKHNICALRPNVGKVRLADGRWFDTGLPNGHSDLVAYKDGRAYFLEVKSPTGRATPDQINFLDTMQNKYGCPGGIVRSPEEALELIGNKEYAEVIHGHWISDVNRDGTKIDKCSNCGNAVKYFEYKYGWCPHCGAIMDKPEARI